MASVVCRRNLLRVFGRSKLGSSRRLLPISGKMSFEIRVLAQKVRAASSAFVETKPPLPTPPLPAVSTVDKEKLSSNQNVLACPICYKLLTFPGDLVLSVDSASGSALQCGICKKTYVGNETHFDFTMAGGINGCGEPMPFATDLFTCKKLFCWSLTDLLGLRWYRISTRGDGVKILQVWLVFQVQRKRNLALVRADISRLHFASSSIDAVHAGAAIHCWPSPSTAVAEISRVLWPGGVLVATTALFDGPFALFPPLLRTYRQLSEITSGRLFLSEDELEDLCRTYGLIDDKFVRNERFVMISASKPRFQMPVHRLLQIKEQTQ